MRALRVIVVIEAAVLALAVGLMLHSEAHTRFAPSVAVRTPTLMRAASAVPVSVDLGSTGSTTTTEAALSRGGRARGTAGFRRLRG